MTRVIVQPNTVVVRNTQTVNRVLDTSSTTFIKNATVREVLVRTDNVIELLTSVGPTGATGPIGPEGPEGPEGPAGPAGEEDMPYAKRFDFENTGDVIYEGQADPGTAEGLGVWRIKKTTFINLEGDATVEWADGNSNFDNIWTDRLSLSYS